MPEAMSSYSAASLPVGERQLLEDLYRGRSLSPYAPGQVIPLFPEEWVIVCRGVVQLTTLYPNGGEALLGFAGPSMPLGSPLTMLDPYQAKALTAVDVLRLSAAEVEASETLSQGLLKQLVRRLRQTEALLALAGRRRVEDRLRQLLSLLAVELGSPIATGVRLQVRLTHQDLANAIGTTRVTITRLLNRFRQQGWIAVDKNRHLIIKRAQTP
ncbi:Crp/Fnr family transcriptional regulator [Synechococcus sp. B60.1]|uniref:Crp/Fnr family transcriptional regulator n=2 Tax=unclassified Synechococcus TaxID=2626047 RepID=UPI0039C2DCCC